MATTFTLNYSGQEINNRLARVDDCLAKTAENVDYLQNENNFTIGNNQSQFVFDTSLGTTGTVLTLSTDSVERTYNGTTTHLDWTDIETKTDAAQIYLSKTDATTTYLAKEVSPWNYSQISDGFRIGRSYNNQSGGVINEFMELVTMQTGDTDATSVGLNTLPALVFSTDLITTDSGHSNLYAIFAQINALGIRFWHGVEGDYTVKYIPFDNIVSSTNLKTINGETILGSGNIQVAADVESITNAEIEVLFHDPILENNDWETIEAVCRSGQAGKLWSVGDTKTDVGTDGVTRTFRIADMQGLYGKHVVFEQVELEDTDYRWNPTSNVDNDNCYNNYSISEMRTTHLPAILAKYSLELQAAITPTTYQVAKNGNNGTLLELEDKLFLPAEREIFSSRNYSRTEEFNALTRFQLYAANDTTEFRKKYRPGATSASIWWLRSPYFGRISHACYVYSGGGASYGSVPFSSGDGVCPFFSF